MLAKGLRPALLAAILWAVVGVLSFWNFHSDHQLSSSGATVSRVVVNLIFVLAMHRFFRKERNLPWGDFSKALWLWGFLGAVTITSFFAAVREIGAGEATLLQGTQGVLIALLAPKILGERRSLLAILGSFLGMTGLCLLFGWGFSLENMGKIWGLISGIAGGFAYMLLAKQRGRHSKETISFYWCIVTLLFLVALGLIFGISFSWKSSTLAILLISGIFASLAQWLTSLAYECAPASLVSATSYLVPAIGFLLEYLLFQKQIGLRIALALLCILSSGFLIPILQWRINYSTHIQAMPLEKSG